MCNVLEKVNVFAYPSEKLWNEDGSAYVEMEIGKRLELYFKGDYDNPARTVLMQFPLIAGENLVGQMADSESSFPCSLIQYSNKYIMTARDLLEARYDQFLKAIDKSKRSKSEKEALRMYLDANMSDTLTRFDRYFMSFGELEDYL